MCFKIETLLINRLNNASYKRTWILNFALSKKSEINLLDGFELASLFCTIFSTLTSEQREESFFSLFESFFLHLVLFECLWEILLSVSLTPFCIHWLGLHPIQAWYFRQTIICLFSVQHFYIWKILRWLIVKVHHYSK